MANSIYHTYLFNPGPIKDLITHYNYNHDARIIHHAVSMVYELLVDTHGDQILKEDGILDSIIYQHYLELVQDGALPSAIGGPYYELLQEAIRYIFRHYAGDFLYTIRNTNPPYLTARVVKACLTDDHSALLVQARRPLETPHAGSRTY